VGESVDNRSWDEVLAESLRNKLRSEGMRTDFVGRSATAPVPKSAPQTAPVSPPAAPPAVPKAPPPKQASPPGAFAMSPPAGGATSAEMVVDQLRRSLGPRDEKRAMDILRGRGGSRGTGALVAAGVLAVLLSATTAFVLGRRPGGGGLRLDPALEPPREAPLPGAARVASDTGGTGKVDVHARPPACPETGGDAIPAFRLGRAATETEWVDLGGPLVDLDRSPPRMKAGP